MILEFSQSISWDLKETYDFFSQPENIGRIQKTGAPFRLLKSEKVVRKGMEMWFEIKVAKILPMVLGFEVVECEPPHVFADRMIHGPFKKFRHTHRFENRDGKTYILDRLDIVLPWFFGGELATRIFVAPGIRKVFTNRQVELDNLVSELEKE